MKVLLRVVGERLLAAAAALRFRLGRLPRAVRIGRLGTWSTISLAFLIAAVLIVLSVVSYTGVQLARFERTDARRTMIVYAAPQALTPGLNVRRIDLPAILARL